MNVSKNQKQQKFYNSSNPQYLDYEKNRPYAQHLINRLLTQLPNTDSLKILEIGAGQGRFSIELSKHVGELTATDLSEKQIEILKGKFEARNTKFEGKNSKNSTTHNPQPTTHNPQPTTHNLFIDCFVQDLLKPPSKELKGKKFDAIVGFFMLHHIDRSLYPQVLQSVLPLLKKGGRMVFIEPNCLYPFHLVEMMIEPDMHWEIEKQIYSNYLGSFKRSAEESGLKPIAFERFGFFPPPIINRFPFVRKIDLWIEKIPFIHQILTPFILLSFEKG